SKVPLLAKSAGIVERPSVTLTLSGREGSVDELTKYYEVLSKQLGFNPPVVEGKGTKTVKIVFTAKPGAQLTPSQVFAFEQGVHRVSHVDGGKTRLHAVNVNIDKDSIALATPAGGAVRAYDFTGRTPIVVDNPATKSSSQEIPSGADQGDAFQRAIGRRLFVVP
ncbi:MAG: hypothetical protein ABL994_26195, partial [Verrucomicrobiales bacterium]